MSAVILLYEVLGCSVTSHVQDLDYIAVSPQIGLKFADASTTLYAQSAKTTASYLSAITLAVALERVAVLGVESR